jgi:hypothetical protein
MPMAYGQGAASNRTPHQTRGNGNRFGSEGDERTNAALFII